MECINLQEQFGTRYRITFDPAYSPKHVPRDKLNPCMMQMPCQRGVVYPHGGGLLAVEVEGRRVTANRLRQLDCTTTFQEGDSFLAVTFHAADFDKVAAIVKPKRRRQVSDAERLRLASIGFQQTAQPAPVSGPVIHAKASA
jgi:hypothetical protein